MSVHANLRLPALAWSTLVALAAMILASIASTSMAGELDAEQLKGVVQKHLRAKVDYRPGDLICRGDVEPIFNELIDRGLKTTGDIEDLYDSFLLDSSPLAQLLRTPLGRTFMRGVSSFPNAYDRLERFSWFADGRNLLNELVASPEGPQLFQTLIEPENLKELEQKLAADPRSRNLRLPTGHVYTAAQLLVHLQKKFTAPKGK